MVNETSIKTTCVRWHGSHLYGNENTCIPINFKYHLYYVDNQSLSSLLGITNRIQRGDIVVTNSVTMSIISSED